MHNLSIFFVLHYEENGNSAGVGYLFPSNAGRMLRESPRELCDKLRGSINLPTAAKLDFMDC